MSESERRASRYNATRALAGRHADAKRAAADVLRPFQSLSEALEPYATLKASMDAALAMAEPAEAIAEAMGTFEEATGHVDRPIATTSLEVALHEAQRALTE